MERKTILLLASAGMSTNIVFNSINSYYNIENVIIEQKENNWNFLRRRLKRLGLIKVVGQILFRGLITPILTRLSAKRIQALMENNQLNCAEIPATKIVRVRSINDIKSVDLLKSMKADLIIVNGTRIISKTILAAVNCPIINTHAGITPMYRGVHGAYWALVANDKEHCGVTVHLVDAGIDTGGVLYQAIINIESQDNIVTYPILQLCQGVELLRKAINDAWEGNMKVVKTLGTSKLWYHPTLWEYLYYWLIKQIK